MSQDREDFRQIIRHDGRSCFMEVLNDAFPIGKVHLGFYKYDMTQPQGSRYTDQVQYYLDIPAFLSLCHSALSGQLHRLAAAARQAQDTKPLYQALSGTSAERLAKRGKAREDGMSVSRQLRLLPGTKYDYLLQAESGAGECNKTGLIVPRYGGSPENKVSIALSRQDLDKILLTVKLHIAAYLSAQYGRFVREEEEDDWPEQALI